MNTTMRPLTVLNYTATTSLGAGRAAQLEALRAGRSGLAPQRFDNCGLEAWVGEVAGLDRPLPSPWTSWECRNNRLIELGLQQDGFMEAVASLRARHGAARIGVFIGTSTAGVEQTERAYRLRDRGVDHLPEWFNYQTSQNANSAAEYVRQRLRLEGVSVTISTACSSSAKVFASARRALATGLCDAAVVGGSDSLCLTTLYGFNALQLVSPEPCRPADVGRRGISIGEAASFALLAPAPAEADLCLLGYGESSDAHHMSAPEPEGRGAAEAMQAALTRAGLAPESVGYIHLHGTATPANDLAEDRAVFRLFGGTVPSSSTKGYFGHTLGAAGMVGATVALLAIEHGFAPGSLNTRLVDPALHARILLEGRPLKLQHALSNAFGFGGNNCSLLFGRQP